MLLFILEGEGTYSSRPTRFFFSIVILDRFLIRFTFHWFLIGKNIYTNRVTGHALNFAPQVGKGV